MANYFPGQRVKLKSGNFGTIEKILLDHSLAMNTRYQLAMEPHNALIGINGLDIEKEMPPIAEGFFAHQRRVVRAVLGSGAQKVATFREILHRGHQDIGARKNIKVELVLEESRPPSSSASVVFMGMKTIPEDIVLSIHKYGIAALKYIPQAAKVSSGIETIGHQSKEGSQAETMRRSFIQDLPVHGSGQGFDEYRLLQIANAHKSGTTQTSGFHSTSGKPDYASEYADASGQLIGKPQYNFGVAIEITDKCYPLVIQEAIDQWNLRSEKGRFRNSKIVMAFAKSEETWKRDYESEIILGGATPATDFVYFGVWSVTRTSLGIMQGLGSELAKFKK